MEIDCGWRNMLLSSLCAGTLIYYKSDFYIVTNTHPADKLSYIYCVNVSSGELVTVPTDILVTTVDEAVLKIGGYYK